MLTVAPVTPRALDRTDLFRASRQPELVRVPELAYIMIDGRGDPNTSADYRDAIQALYALSYTLKFGLKKELGLSHPVGALEGLWWSDDMTGFGDGDSKAGWHWTSMIVQPDEVTPERFALARAEAGRKKEIPALTRARLERFEEGICAQVLHIGPYSAEGPTIARLHAFIGELGGTFDGRVQKHHEIYLGDPRRSAPEKWRTIIRQPVVGI